MRPNQVGYKARRASTSGLGLALMTLFSTLAFAGTAGAAKQVPLGTAEPFGVLAGTTVTNTGATVVNGDLGVSPGTAITGFPPGIVNGTMHSADTTAAAAEADLTAAYLDAAGQPVTDRIATELGGRTIFPGVYDSAAGDFGITGTLTLNAKGDPKAVFIFKTASTLVTAAGNSNVKLVNGAQSCHVFWQVGSSATLGTNTVFRGDILALTAITATTGAVVDGRLLARNAATTLDSNRITRARCASAPPTPTVRLTNVPERCVARNFKMRVKVSDSVGVARTDVFLDGKRIKRSKKASFTVTIPASGLDRGRHNIRVVSTNDAGNTTVKKARFGVCERAGINFTG